MLLAGLPAICWRMDAWSHWRHPALSAGLIVLSVVALLGELRFKRATDFFPVDAIVTLALFACGPIPALLALLVPDLITRLAFKRLPASSWPAWATYASYGWAIVAGAALLTLTGNPTGSVADAPALLAAGLAWQLVNYLLTRGAFVALWEGRSLWPAFRDEYVAVLPASVGLLVIATVVAVATPALGPAVLLLLAPVVIIPQVLLPALAKSRDVSRLDQATATTLYVRALGAHLGAGRQARRVMVAAAALAGGPGRELSRTGLRLPSGELAVRLPTVLATRAWNIALHAPERWDGTGPAGLAARRIPKESRLVAVAAEWAKLTAAGGPRLSQTEAALALTAQAETRFDPRIVEAASEIVTTEAQFADLASFQPRLDVLPLPAGVRMSLLPRVLGAYAPAA